MRIEYKPYCDSVMLNKWDLKNDVLLKGVLGLKKRLLIILIVMMSSLIGCDYNSSTSISFDNEPRRNRIIQTIISSDLTLPNANIGMYGDGYYISWDIESFDDLHDVKEKNLCLLTDSSLSEGETVYVKNSLNSWERYGIWLNEDFQYNRIGTHRINLYVGHKEIDNLHGGYNCEISKSYEITYKVEEKYVTDNEYIISKEEITIKGEIFSVRD